jgi:hypothetical protein
MYDGGEKRFAMHKGNLWKRKGFILSPEWEHHSGDK